MKGIATAAGKVTEDLRAFAKMNEGRLYKLLKTCMDTSSDVKAICRASVRPSPSSLPFYTIV